ncbi:GrpB family protein [Thalassotalea montiporae]
MIEIVDYDARWPQLFSVEKQHIERIVSHWLCGTIEHVGSTSIVGLTAKPVIDIMVGVKSLNHAQDAIQVLVDSGYCYYPYKPEVMHWFCKPSPEIRTHHLHLVPYQSPLWHERTLFRDYLRAHQSVAIEYAKLKRQLAIQYPEDRERYTQGKWQFIEQVLRRAQEEGKA